MMANSNHLWRVCLRAITATAIPVKEISKLSLGQDVQFIGQHSVESYPQWRSLLNRRVSNARTTQYLVLLLDAPRVTIQKVDMLNPATLLSDKVWSWPYLTALRLWVLSMGKGRNWEITFSQIWKLYYLQMEVATSETQWWLKTRSSGQRH